MSESATNQPIQVSPQQSSSEPGYPSRWSELAELMAQYEEQHAVETYFALGWHVWPLLRIWVTYELRGYWNAIRPTQNPSTVFGSTFGSVRHFSTLATGMIKARLCNRSNYERPDAAKRDVVILTFGNRRQLIGMRYVNRISDPFVEWLGNHGFSSLVWELGDVFPRNSPSALITYPLAFEGKFVDRKTRLGELCASPDWYHEFATWFGARLGRHLSWEECRNYIRNVSIESRVFERWLKQIQPKTLLVDCWYSRTAMAATLAAHRLGIRSVDIQHGTQGPYRSWSRVPEGGFETVPDSFWFWGLSDAEDCSANSHFGASRVIGGNLWLNLWREGKQPEFRASIESARQLKRGFDKTVLVSFDEPQEYHTNLISELVMRSPREWRWLIRLHPGMRQHLDSLSKQLCSLNHPGVNVTESSLLPLYALLTICDVHLTRTSTCALEALAFGLPTVVVHEEGRSIFKDYIDAGAMRFADRPEQILNALASSDQISQAECRRQGNNIFAEVTDSEEALKQLAAQVTEAKGTGRTDGSS